MHQEGTTNLLSLPFSDPVLVFATVLLIIILSQVLLQKARLPGIIGYILAGVAVGPNGLNILQIDSSITLFGTAGLLYIMFLAGLDLDMNQFAKKRYRSLFFGLMTFGLPMITGYFVCRYLLNFSQLGSILVSSMFSTHTLVAFPIASRMGIIKNESVTITIGGTIITDTLVLLLLAFITSAHTGQLNSGFWLRLTAMSLLLLVSVFWLYPIIGRWYFKHIEGEKSSPYIFILLMVFAAAFLSKLAGLEPIIGAFIAGLALNKLISGNTVLMNRIEFVGNALFIPFFLIGVGMVVDLRVLAGGPYALYVAAVLTIVALAGKWLAALITQIVFGYTKLQRQLIFGLSSTHAAATLAVIFIGYKIELVDIHVLNGTIILILVTCLVGSLVTDQASRKMAVSDSSGPVEVPAFPERILIPVANPATIESLLEVAVAFKKDGSPEPVYPISVVEDNENSQSNLITCRRNLEKALEAAASSEVKAQALTRVDINIASGIVRAVKEIMASMLILGWGGALRTSDRIFGTLLSKIINETWQMTLVTRLRQPMHTFRRIVVIQPPNAEFEVGFQYWMSKILSLSQKNQMRTHFLMSADATTFINALNKRLQTNVAFTSEIYPDWETAIRNAKDLPQDELLVVIAARDGTISYIPQLDELPARLNLLPKHQSYLLLFPEQTEKIRGTGVIPASDIHLAPIKNRMEQINQAKQAFLRTFVTKFSKKNKNG